MRRLDPLTPDEARELDALERALAGEPVDPDLHELSQLVHDLRATAPEMSPAFATRLQRDVADGFPEPVERPVLRRPRRWVLLPAAGVLAAALIALVVVLGQRGGDEPSTLAIDRGPATAAKAPAGEAPAAAPEAAADSAGATTADRQSAPKRSSAAPAPSSAGAGSGSGAAQALVAPPAPAATAAKPGAPRKVQRSVTLSLEAPFDEVGSTSDDVIRTVDRFNGIVASSSINDAGEGAEATFDLRIPTARLDAALAALSKLGHVANRTQDLQDITSSFTSVQDRLSDARAERRGLLRALGRASTQAQIDSLKARLRESRGRIARLNGDLAALRRRADLSVVALSVTGVQDKGGAGGGTWSPGDAAGDALRVLEVMAGVALVALAIALPLALLALAIALAARLARRRGRERALDPA
jgi:hypothetical protein